MDPQSIEEDKINNGTNGLIGEIRPKLSFSLGGVEAHVAREIVREYLPKTVVCPLLRHSTRGRVPVNTLWSLEFRAHIRSPDDILLHSVVITPIDFAGASIDKKCFK